MALSERQSTEGRDSCTLRQPMGTEEEGRERSKYSGDLREGRRVPHENTVSHKIFDIEKLSYTNCCTKIKHKHMLIKKIKHTNTR